MKTNRKPTTDDYTELCGHDAVRPIKYCKGPKGHGWLCDNDVDPAKDLRNQHCWRCDEMPFPAGGR